MQHSRQSNFLTQPLVDPLSFLFWLTHTSLFFQYTIREIGNAIRPSKDKTKMKSTIVQTLGALYRRARMSVLRMRVSVLQAGYTVMCVVISS